MSQLPNKFVIKELQQGHAVHVMEKVKGISDGIYAATGSGAWTEVRKDEERKIDQKDKMNKTGELKTEDRLKEEERALQLLEEKQEKKMKQLAKDMYSLWTLSIRMGLRQDRVAKYRQELGLPPRPAHMVDEKQGEEMIEQGQQAVALSRKRRREQEMEDWFQEKLKEKIKAMKAEEGDRVYQGEKEDGEGYGEDDDEEQEMNM